MKISEAMLYIIEQAGGEIEFGQWQKWERALVEAGYLQDSVVGTGTDIKSHVALTDKGRAFVAKTIGRFSSEAESHT